MGSGLSVFPVLDARKKSRLRITLTEDYSFSYTRDSEDIRLEAEDVGGSGQTCRIEDNDGMWNPDDYNLIVRRSGQIMNTSFLFGENGIACSNAVLGVAFLWESSDSKQRGAVEAGEIHPGDNMSEFRINYEFRRAQLRGRVNFRTILYLKQAGTPHSGEKHLANMYGCILGEIDRYTLLIDGNGSVFPIYEVSEPGAPLWYVKCEWDDPTSDQFSDTVSVILNKAHPGYKYLDKTRKTFDPELMKEVIAESLLIIISNLKEDRGYWEDTVNGQSLERGSVSEAVYYFVNTLGWQVSSPEAVSISIHNYFDRKVPVNENS